MTESNELDPRMDHQHQTEDHLEELSDQLNDALESMQRGESPAHFSADPAFQAAVKLHVLTSESTPDEATQRHIQQRVLERCAKTAGESKGRWAYWLVPLVSAGAVAVVVFFMSTGTGTESLTVALKNINTVLSGQNTRNTNASENVNDNDREPTQTSGQNNTQAFVPTTKTLLADADALTDANITEEITDLGALEEELNASMQDVELVIEQLDALQDADTEVDSANTALLQLSSL